MLLYIWNVVEDRNILVGETGLGQRMRVPEFEVYSLASSKSLMYKSD